MDDRALEQFGLHINKTNQKPFYLPGNSLLTNDGLNRLFGRLSQTFDGPKRIQASMFVKYYSKAVVMSACYAFSHHNLLLRIPKDQYVFETDENEWTPQVSVGPIPDLKPITHRNQMMNQLIHTVFYYHLTPLFNRLSLYSGVHSSILWANISNYVYHYYRSWQENATTYHEQLQLAADFERLLSTPGRRFGLTCIESPLKMSYKKVQHPLNDTETLNVRSVCCLKHRLNNNTYCTVCPKLSCEGRKELFEEKYASKK